MAQRKSKPACSDPFTYENHLVRHRKFELFIRDPAAMVMEGVIEPKDVPSETLALLHDGGLEKKWNTTIWRLCEPSTGPFSTIQLGGTRQPIYDGRNQYRVEQTAVRKITSTGPRGVEETEYYRYLRVPEGTIPLVIYPDLLTLNDARRVKNHLWNIVEREILKSKQNKESVRGWKPHAPEDEPPEIAFIYRIKEETFKKYLRWYDLKMSGGLSFRIIAFYESKINDPRKREQAFESESSRTRKTKIGQKVKGESAVRMGFYRIYLAIHRTAPPHSETDIPRGGFLPIKAFTCPQHPSNSCDTSCAHLKVFMEKFDGVYPA